MSDDRAIVYLAVQPGIANAQIGQQLGNRLLIITFDNGNMLEVEGQFKLNFYEARTDRQAKGGGSSGGGA